MTRRRRILATTTTLLVAAAALAGCAGTSTYELPLMPPPEYLDAADFDPFRDSALLPPDGRPDLLYATLRLPAEPGDGQRHYSNERAQLLRLGTSHVEASKNTTWEQLRDIGLVRSNGDKFTLRIGDVTEFGALATTRAAMDGDAAARAADMEATRRFATAVDEQLSRRQVQDVFVYVHGYRVNFENPLLVAAELWHFMGYEGVFIPFAWPSRTGRLAYFGDTESARYSARAFRAFLAFLATETRARRIHVVGYSAGTRLVLASMHELALLGDDRSATELRATLRLGNVILVGSDVDLGIAGNYVQDGMLKVAERFTFYESPADSALGMARRVLGQRRAGQLLDRDLRPELREFLAANPDLTLIDVESAPFFDSGNGHGYFRNSPRVSSDLLTTLRYDLGPEERGLVRPDGAIAWTFPEDYIDRLRSAIAERGGTDGIAGDDGAQSTP